MPRPRNLDRSDQGNLPTAPRYSTSREVKEVNQEIKVHHDKSQSYREIELFTDRDHFTHSTYLPRYLGATVGYLQPQSLLIPTRSSITTPHSTSPSSTLLSHSEPIAPPRPVCAHSLFPILSLPLFINDIHRSHSKRK